MYAISTADHAEIVEDAASEGETLSGPAVFDIGAGIWERFDSLTITIKGMPDAKSAIALGDEISALIRHRQFGQWKTLAPSMSIKPGEYEGEPIVVVDTRPYRPG